MFTFRFNYFIIAIFLFLTEVAIALFVHDQLIRPYVGDLLVVILIYSFVKSFVNVQVPGTAISVLIFAWLVETLQYFNLVIHLGLANSKTANIILGNSFSWIDILAYTLGICIVLVIEVIRLSKQRTAGKVTVALFTTQR